MTTTTRTIRRAHVRTSATRTAIERYLPGNYTIEQQVVDGFIVRGQDNAGWTLEDYVIPRLASGLHWAEEITSGVES